MEEFETVHFLSVHYVWKQPADFTGAGIFLWKEIISLRIILKQNVMLARDLIAQIIRTFYEELEDVRDGGRLGDMGQRYGDLYETYFQNDRSFFLKSDIKDIVAFFSEDPDAVYKYEMLAELMYREAKIVTDGDLRQVMFARIVELYEILDSLSMDFSFVRMNRVQELKNELKR